MKDFIAAYNGSMDKGCWLRLHSLTTYLAEAGHRVHLIVPDEFVLPSHENISRISMSRPKWKVFGLEKIVAAVQAAFLSARRARHARDPVLLAFDTHNGISFLGGRFVRASRALFIRGDVRFQGRYNEPYLFGLFIRALNRPIKRRADVVIYNNRAAQRRDTALIAHSDTQAYTIHNDSSVAPQCRIPRRKGPFTIGYCGQLSRRKNVEFLIKAFLELDDPTSRLIIQGNWHKYPWVKRYQDRARYPNIEFRRWRPDTSGFYDDIDLFVLPSLFDDFSNAALDAIAHGIPVLLSRTGGSPEMVEFHERLLFDIGQGESYLARRIGEVMQNYPTACHDMAALAAKYRFDWPRQVTRTLQLAIETTQRTPGEKKTAIVRRG